MRLNEAIALRVNELLEEQKMTAYRLSLRSGVSQATISDVRTRRNNSVSVRVVYEIAQGFGLNLAEFFDCKIFREEDILD